MNFLQLTNMIFSTIAENIPQVPLTEPPELGTPEHKAYFYQQVEESINRTVKKHTTESV